MASFIVFTDVGVGPGGVARREYRIEFDGETLIEELTEEELRGLRVCISTALNDRESLEIGLIAAQAELRAVGDIVHELAARLPPK